jgi:uncharacterized spore protein YtfJ
MVQPTEDTAILDRIRDIVDGASAGRVFGEPIAHEGVVVLPAAKVSGGAGGGTGPAEKAQQPGSGTGGGFGVSAKALGVFVIREGGKVQWQPAVDVNKIVLGGQLVAVTALLLVRAIVKARSTGHKQRRPARLHVPRLGRH